MSATTQASIETRPAPTLAPSLVKIEIEGNPRGQYRVFHEGHVLIERTGEPFFSAARALLAEGRDPDATVVMSRAATPDRVDISGRLGRAATMTVIEGRTSGPRFGKWTPFAATDDSQ